jgi:hypothetical protein
LGLEEFWMGTRISIHRPLILFSALAPIDSEWHRNGPPVTEMSILQERWAAPSTRIRFLISRHRPVVGPWCGFRNRRPVVISPANSTIWITTDISSKACRTLVDSGYSVSQVRLLQRRPIFPFTRMSTHTRRNLRVQSSWNYSKRSWGNLLLRGFDFFRQCVASQVRIRQKGSLTFHVTRVQLEIADRFSNIC